MGPFLWDFDTLQQVKEAVKFSSSNPKGKLMWEAIQSPDDCFGQGYDAKSEECRNCTAQVSAGGFVDEFRLICVAVIWLFRLKRGDIIQPNKCCCGCGKLVKPGQRFIKGHFWRGKHFSENHKQKLSQAQPNKKSAGLKYLQGKFSRTLDPVVGIQTTGGLRRSESYGLKWKRGGRTKDNFRGDEEVIGLEVTG